MIPNTIEFMTYNICYSRRAYEPYTWENRRDEVYKQIAGDIIFLQEIFSPNQDEVKARLANYTWHFEPTNARNGMCCNAIGIKKGFMPNTDQKPFSFNFASIEKTAEKVQGLMIGNVCLINAHFSMEEAGRMAMADNLEKCLPEDKPQFVIIAGDFNSFLDARGSEQVKTACKVTDTVCVSDEALSETTKELAIRSFKAYPYDKVPEGALALPGKLDHIAAKGFSVRSHPIVMDAVLMPGHDFAPSDHYAMKATLYKNA